MATITIQKKQYQSLLEKALRYEYIREIMKENLFASPSVRDTKEIIKSFKETGKYNDKFLKSLEKGLKRSSYFK
ncbi:hypothetical protein KAT95_02015 [Candidatus Parcubacteria bacterium]|nr:hypothetical protein [Candidatus Parcubacteria bacterium]